MPLQCRRYNVAAKDNAATMSSLQIWAYHRRRHNVAATM